MSCAHSFGEWCQECIDGVVQQYNTVRRDLASMTAERDALQQREILTAEEVIKEVARCHGEEVFISSGYAAHDDLVMWMRRIVEDATKALTAENAALREELKMPDTKQEIGWLIERHTNSTLEYWTGRGTEGSGWTRESNEACRFARFEDASVVLSWLLDGNGRVVEHMWCLR